MIDGVSADYFENHRGRLPNLSSLADDGYVVRRMRSPVPGTSMPGRASILTGVGTDKHGIFGNRVPDNGVFVGAEVDHVRVPTIATLAASAGLDVACIGHALIKPEDASIYVPPCWLRGPGFTKVPSDGSISTLLRVKDPRNRLAAVTLPSYAIRADQSNDSSRLTDTLIGDQLNIGAAASLLQSEHAPDFVITEINTTDYFQHDFGYESDEGHFAVAFADALVGTCLESLRRANRREDYAIVVVSDHGHGNISRSIFPDLIIPGKVWQAEGATLHVLVKDEQERQEVANRLSSYGVQSWNNDHVPVELSDKIATFMAPEDHDFEETPADHSSGEPIGRPKYKSTHGFRPGLPADDRMCICSGAGVPKGVEETVNATRLTPTLASILGLPLDPFADRPLF
ncbi:alkaline phosphatase family protein [Sinorhizobium fredii]|uniref:alkaline phosphatase family protein n=1 Tax=Rhizobium fredii TaxID=380 RepID=UPI0012FD2DE0|nr:alkaline phosphatase family protein [Sinorhizobium fredii]